MLGTRVVQHRNPCGCCPDYNGKPCKKNNKSYKRIFKRREKLAWQKDQQH